MASLLMQIVIVEEAAEENRQQAAAADNEKMRDHLLKTAAILDEAARTLERLAKLKDPLMELLDIDRANQ